MGSGEPYLYDRSGEQYAIDAPRWRGNDHTPLMVSELPGIGREDVEGRVRSQWRYLAALPYQLRETISLGEGCTPLLPCHLNGADVFVKPEWFNPTSSFKDRGTSVMLSALKDQGVTGVLEDSSGNGGSSVAAYAAAGGIKAKILVPASTSPAKIVQTRRHGAEIELVPGIRQDTADEAVRQSESIFYSSHNWHPFFLQGIKLLAYEIWEDLDFTAPESVVVPAGAGSLVLGLSIGFNELLRSGQIHQIPRILAVQPENCSPMAKAFAVDSPAPLEGEWKPSFAEGASITRPVRGPEVLKAARESHGAIITVTEDQIRAATTELAHKGLYAEPTSAMVSAALPAFTDLGLIRPGERTVLVLTGSALKATAIPE